MTVISQDDTNKLSNFQPISDVHRDWKKRVPVGTSLTLTRNKVVMTTIIGSKKKGKQLLVNTSNGIYIHVGNELNQKGKAKKILTDMIFDYTAFMPPPVRITAVNLKFKRQKKSS